MGNLFDGGGVLNGLSLNVVGIAATCCPFFIMLSFLSSTWNLLCAKYERRRSEQAQGKGLIYQVLTAQHSMHDDVRDKQKCTDLDLYNFLFPILSNRMIPAAVSISISICPTTIMQPRF